MKFVTNKQVKKLKIQKSY